MSPQSAPAPVSPLARLTILFTRSHGLTPVAINFRAFGAVLLLVCATNTGCICLAFLARIRR